MFITRFNVIFFSLSFMMYSAFSTGSSQEQEILKFETSLMVFYYNL